MFVKSHYTFQKASLGNQNRIAFKKNIMKTAKESFGKK